MSTSREWAKFKRFFVGPIMPRSIRKQRREAIPSEPITPAFNSRMKDYDPRKLWNRKDIHRLTKPLWANDTAIDEVYKAAKSLTESTGVIYHVDHIIPIRHPLVCGLHVENNLRAIPATENMQKSNSFVVE
jgi:hypothetical protein